MTMKHRIMAREAAVCMGWVRATVVEGARNRTIGRPFERRAHW